MYALSLLQPWAQLVVTGAKPDETRSWKTDHRGRIFIHASAKKTEANRFFGVPPFSKHYSSPAELEFGKIIGYADVTDIITTEKWLENFKENTDPLACDHRVFGDFSDNRHACKQRIFIYMVYTLVYSATGRRTGKNSSEHEGIFTHIINLNMKNKKQENSFPNEVYLRNNCFEKVWLEDKRGFYYEKKYKHPVLKQVIISVDDRMISISATSFSDKKLQNSLCEL